MDKVSVIIPTYNRFNCLLNAINSVKKQTYKNIEIILINDCSTDEKYYTYDFKDVNIIHLEENSKKKFGYPCAGYVRTIGMKKATGKYIAFLDDDDIWFPNKLELQINAMKKTGCKMSCTDGLNGFGVYNPNKKYLKFNAERCLFYIINKYCNTNYMKNGFPEIWTLDFLKINNCVICSSVVVEKEILEKINYMKFIHMNQYEDYDCWLRVLEYTNCVYVKDICFYYDMGHGNGMSH
jgi:glycosyltransferase involved in cell wall biosynthesis